MQENQTSRRAEQRRKWDATYRERHRDERRAYDRERMRQIRSQEQEQEQES